MASLRTSGTLLIGGLSPHRIRWIARASPYRLMHQRRQEIPVEGGDNYLPKGFTKVLNTPVTPPSPTSVGTNPLGRSGALMVETKVSSPAAS
jgi:hypothetical protein